jgi:hypothetical protein
MNKKTVSLILVVCCLLLIIVVSVLGKAPENSSKIPVDSIEFIDSRNEGGLCEVNDENKKIIKIPVGTKTYQLEYVINPTEATEKDVYFFIMGDDSIATVDDNGFVTFHKETSITVKIVSNYTDNKMDFVIIEFTGNKGEDVTDDPFAKGGK